MKHDMDDANGVVGILALLLAPVVGLGFLSARRRSVRRDREQAKAKTRAPS